mmetsp:Transcript_9756/g.11245  ORF Transcript_9756/g.11245 Transcript_9756/m.11245 type:complete len:93 (+) Transcript_9756:384-662(+)
MYLEQTLELWVSDFGALSQSLVLLQILSNSADRMPWDRLTVVSHASKHKRLFHSLHDGLKPLEVYLDRFYDLFLNFHWGVCHCRALWQPELS